jgi:uncharacterized membrane protein
MTTMSTTPSEENTESPATRPRIVRWIVGVTLVFAGLFVWYYLRGTWATATPEYPAAAEQGVVSQLVKNTESGNEIHTAVVVPVPVETAWSILSNYEEWERLFKTVREREPTKQLDENRHHVVSDVITPLGVLQLDFIVTHEKTPEGGYRAWWDAPTDDLPVNRGEITIAPQGPDATLLVYVIEKRYKQYPQFLVYNLLFDQQADVVGTLRQRMLEIAQEQ